MGVGASEAGGSQLADLNAALRHSFGQGNQINSNESSPMNSPVDQAFAFGSVSRGSSRESTLSRAGGGFGGSNAYRPEQTSLGFDRHDKSAEGRMHEWMRLYSPATSGRKQSSSKHHRRKKETEAARDQTSSSRKSTSGRAMRSAHMHASQAMHATPIVKGRHATGSSRRVTSGKRSSKTAAQSPVKQQQWDVAPYEQEGMDELVVDEDVIDREDNVADNDDWAWRATAAKKHAKQSAGLFDITPQADRKQETRASLGFQSSRDPSSEASRGKRHHHRQNARSPSTEDDIVDRMENNFEVDGLSDTGSSNSSDEERQRRRDLLEGKDEGKRRLSYDRYHRTEVESISKENDLKAQLYRAIEDSTGEESDAELIVAAPSPGERQNWQPSSSPQPSPGARTTATASKRSPSGKRRGVKSSSSRRRGAGEDGEHGGGDTRMMSSSSVINALRSENERLKLAEGEVLKQEKMELHKQQGNATRSKSNKPNRHVEDSKSNHSRRKSWASQQAQRSKSKAPSKQDASEEEQKWEEEAQMALQKRMTDALRGVASPRIAQRAPPGVPGEYDEGVTHHGGGKTYAHKYKEDGRGKRSPGQNDAAEDAPPHLSSRSNSSKRVFAGNGGHNGVNNTPIKALPLASKPGVSGVPLSAEKTASKEPSRGPASEPASQNPSSSSRGGSVKTRIRSAHISRGYLATEKGKRSRHQSADIVRHRQRMRKIWEQHHNLQRPPSRQRTPFPTHLTEFEFKKFQAFGQETENKKYSTNAIDKAQIAQRRKVAEDSPRPPSRHRQPGESLYLDDGATANDGSSQRDSAGEESGMDSRCDVAMEKGGKRKKKKELIYCDDLIMESSAVVAKAIEETATDSAPATEDEEGDRNKPRSANKNVGNVRPTSGRPPKNIMRTTKSMSVLEFVASDDGGRPRVVQMQNLYDLTMEPPKEHPIPIQITTRRSDGRHEITSTTTYEVAEAARHRANSAMGDDASEETDETGVVEPDQRDDSPEHDNVQKPFRPSTPPGRPESATPSIYRGKGQRPGSGRKPRAVVAKENTTMPKEGRPASSSRTARAKNTTLRGRVPSASLRGAGAKSPVSSSAKNFGLDSYEASEVEPQRAHTAALDRDVETSLDFGEYQPPLTAYEPSMNAEARAMKKKGAHQRGGEDSDHEVERVKQAAKEAIKTGHRPQSSRARGIQAERARSGRRRPPAREDATSSFDKHFNRRNRSRTELEEANDELRHWEMEMARLRGENAATSEEGDWSGHWHSKDDRDFDAVFGRDTAKSPPKPDNGGTDSSENSRNSIEYDLESEEGKPFLRSSSSDDEWGQRRHPLRSVDRDGDGNGEAGTIITEMESFDGSDFDDFEDDAGNDTHPGTFGSTLGNEFLSLFA